MSSGYKLEDRKGRVVLSHPDSGRKIYLPDIAGGKYIIYGSTDDGDEGQIVWSQLQDEEPQFCSAVMAQAEKDAQEAAAQAIVQKESEERAKRLPRPKTTKVPVTAGAKPLKNMIEGLTNLVPVSCSRMPLYL